MNRRMLLAILMTAPSFGIVALNATEAQANGTETRLIAQLSGAGSQRLASGKAVFRQRNNRIRFSAEVEDVRGVSQVRVYVGGRAVGTAPVIAGTADLNLSGANAPVVTPGTAVRVVDAGNGKIVARGSF